MLGMNRRIVRLEPHDPEWAELFEQERKLLADAFPDTIIAIEHVGSTAIPGIPAKPIIDINIGVESLDVALSMKAGFEKIGYEHRPFVPGHTAEDLKAQELYVKGPEECRTHYVHVAVYGSDFWDRTLLFRDYLRRNADCAQEYAGLKTKLAQEYSNDRGAYSRGKDEFITRTLEMAREFQESEPMIREFSTSDIAPCARLFQSVFNGPPWNDAWSEQAAQERLAEILQTPGALGLVCLSENGETIAFLIGYIERWFDGRHFYLKEMCVRPDMQGQGIGARLLSELTSRLQAAGVSQVYLFTGRDGDAEAFYAKNGYRTSPRMILMSRRLGGT